MNESTLKRPGLDLHLAKDHALLTLGVGEAQLQAHITAKTGEGSITAVAVAESTFERAGDVHDYYDGIRAELATDEPGLGMLFEARVYETKPFVALRAGIRNKGDETVTMLELSPFTTTRMKFGTGALDGWVNGYHSWSFTGFIGHDAMQPRQKPHGLLSPHSINTATPNPKNAGQYTGEWVGALIDPAGSALVAGFIGMERFFGQVVMDGRHRKKSLRLVNTLDGVPLDPGETIWGEWAILYPVASPYSDPIGEYAEAVARETPPRWPKPKPAAGWSSWYQFFADVTLDDMERNQAALKDLGPRLPLKLIQLDDGYQPHWGDWLDHNDKFPGGVRAWADEVRADGFEPGLWLSPYTIDMNSKIAKEHPESILRDENGKIIHGGFLVNRWIKGLDPTHPATQAFVKETIHTIVNQWGIKYLKLDFLYCGALPGVRHDPTKSRAEALRDGFKLIRETAGDDVVILGCGCPLGPALGIFDMMRVSPDVAPHWYPDIFGVKRPFEENYAFPSARNSISISLARSWQHQRWWWLDADNLLVREAQDLTEDEIRTLATIMGMTGSHLIVSDDLPKINDERVDWAACLLPQLDGRPDTPTLFDETNPSVLVRQMEGADGPYSLVALINWTDEACDMWLRISDLDLPADEPVLLSDFWGGYATLHEGNAAIFAGIPPHGVKLVALRGLNDKSQYAGSDLHFSMGAEVAMWSEQEDKLRFWIKLGRKAEGKITLKLEKPPMSAEVAGKTAWIEEHEEPGLYSMDVVIDDEGWVIIRF